MNNFFLGGTQVVINTSFNLIRKIVLVTVPFTHGLSFLPYGPIAIMQAAIAIHSTKILRKLAAKEILKKSTLCHLDPYQIIQTITRIEPDIFTHTDIYLSNRKLDNNFTTFLP